MKFNFLTLFILLQTATICNTANAIRQYKCNGKIQYFPCLAKSSYGLVSNPQHLIRKPTIFPPRIENLVFKPLKKGIGQWTGNVYGHGQIAIYLYIYNQQHALVEKRLIGKINLIKESTNFGYRSIMKSGGVSFDKWAVIASLAK